VAARSDTPNRFAKSETPISLMYSESVITRLQHKTCSQRKPPKHVRFSEHRLIGTENADMANGRAADPVGIEMGRRIRALRLARGETQEQLAKATGWRITDADDGRARGLSPSRIANYEQGTRRIDIEEAEILARLSDGLTAAYFLCVVDEREARVLHAMRHDLPKHATAP
jgi:transcriptional regulator with XRE-family HTH domain